MIICLIGQSSSGKSTIERELTNRYEDLDRLISYTTRPMRENEVNSEDYFFISEEKFKEMEILNYFQEVAKYRDWYYGISLDGLDVEKNDYIAVVTIHGYEELKKHTNNIVAIHIYVPERERVIRQLNRGDEVDEVVRRIHADRIDFNNVFEISDFIVKNDNVGESVQQVSNIIKLVKQRG